MRQIVVQFDVDDVLADWTEAFTALANGLWPGCTPQHQATTIPYYISKKHFTDPALFDKTWEYLLQCPNWWTSLHQLVFADEFKRIAALARQVPVYFVTNRWHHVNPANLQTTEWLRIMGVPNASVLCTRLKGEAAYLLRTTHSLEDKGENAIDIRNYTLPTSRSYLINRLHNQQRYPLELRVDTVAQFLDLVEKEL